MRFVDVGGWVVPDVVGTFVGPVGFNAGPIYFKAQTEYLYFNACLRWPSSSLSSWVLEQRVLALCVRVLMTWNLTAMLW